jgi:very-short-patch-repair endonuclease
MSSKLELKFINLWRSLHPSIELISEVKLIPKRRFRFDFVHMDSKTAIELNGGNFINGRHTRPVALNNEYEKMNLALLNGYQVFTLSNQMINEKWVNEIYSYILSKRYKLI